MTSRKPSTGRATSRTKRKPATKTAKRVDVRGRSRASVEARAKKALRLLKEEYPEAHCALEHTNPYQLLVATILSAQCTDARVNMVTPVLFSRYPTAGALAAASQDDLEEIIRSTGFFRSKSKNLIAMAQALVADHDGEVPETMMALHALPGVGRKTANVVLGNAFGLNEGIVVDTHVTRLTRLLGLSKEKDAVKIERDLMELFPRKDWALLAHLLIWHGRQVCIARRPRCEACVLAHVCPSARF
jgi:endonuclease-3